MKTKLLTTAAFIIITILSASAQIEKGTIMVGGQIFYGSNKANDVGNSSIFLQENRNAVFQISTGIAFSENNLVGLAVGYSEYSNNVQNISQAQSGNNKGIGAFYRRYNELGNKFYFWAQSDLFFNYSKGNTTSEQSNSDVFVKAVDLSLSPGLSYQVLKKAHIELTLPSVLSVGMSENVYNEKSDPDFAKTNSFNITSSLVGGALQNLGIGFKLFF